MKPDHAIRARDFTVETVPLSVCQDLVSRWHYAGGGSNTATFRHGLFHREDLTKCLGVAWWLPPTKNAAIATYPEGDWRLVVSLSRLVVSPELPQNAASFLIGRSVRHIRADGRFKCLVTYADDWQGHEGTIYRATNWQYLGRTKPEAKWVDETGRQVARKATRTRTNAEMLELGYRRIGSYAKHKYRMVLA